MLCFPTPVIKLNRFNGLQNMHLALNGPDYMLGILQEFSKGTVLIEVDKEQDVRTFIMIYYFVRS